MDQRKAIHMEFSYKTHGTCSQYIFFDIDDEKRLHNVRFISGCDGNLKSIGKLVEGQDAEKISEQLKGITCGFKQTSCGDQLSRAITQALNSMK